MQALTQREVDFAFRVYQALLGGAAGGDEAEAMDTGTQVGDQGEGGGWGKLNSLFSSHVDAASGNSTAEPDLTLCHTRIVCNVSVLCLELEGFAALE